VRIGVDVGGTKIEIAALDANGTIVLRERESSPVGSYENTVRAIKDLVAAAEARLGKRATVGIGTPGAISPATGLIKNANSTWLNGKPFDRDISAALGREVRVMNDANCFTLSEAVDGAGAGKRVVFGVIVGTGTGGGICVDGRLINGPNAIGGEWGHNHMPWSKPEWGELPGPPCYAEQPGCIETWLSGPGLAAEYERVSGRKCPTPQIDDAAAKGDAHAKQTMERYYDRFARALAHVINILDPDVIVIGGGLSNIETIYSRVPPLMTPYVFTDVCVTPILKNKHGDSSGVRGAAWLWREDEAVQSR
jgi:fructokinase